MTFISKLLHIKFSTLYSHSIISQSMWLKCHKLKLISNSTVGRRRRRRRRSYPETPMTIVGRLVPWLMMHQLWDDVLSRHSSRCNCWRIGTPFSLIRFINGAPILWAWSWQGFAILPNQTHQTLRTSYLSVLLTWFDLFL